MQSPHSESIAVERKIITHPSLANLTDFIEIGLKIDRIRNLVSIYELDKRDGSNGLRAGDFLFQICDTLTQQYFAAGQISSIKWEYRSGFAHTQIRFRQREPGITVMRLSNILGIDCGGGLLEEYQSGFFEGADRVQLGSDTLRPPVSGKTFYIMISADKSRAIYLAGRNGAYESDYKIAALDASEFITIARDHQPLIYQATPELMMQNGKSNAGLTVRKAIAMTKLYCRLHNDGSLQKVEIVEVPESSLGLIDKQFPVFLIRVRRGKQAEALDSICGIGTVVPSAADTGKDTLAKPPIVQSSGS